MQSHPNFVKDQINVFSCNIAEENLCDHIMPASVDIVTLVSLGGLYKIMVLVIYFYCGPLTILENLDEHLLFCNQVFTLSAVSPEKMPTVIQNLRHVLKVTLTTLFSVFINCQNVPNRPNQRKTKTARLFGSAKTNRFGGLSLCIFQNC